MMPSPRHTNDVDLSELGKQIAEGYFHINETLKGMDIRLRTVEDFQVARGATIKADDKALVLASNDQNCEDIGIKDRLHIVEEFMHDTIPVIKQIKWLTAAMIVQILAFVSACVVILIFGVIK